MQTTTQQQEKAVAFEAKIKAMVYDVAKKIGTRSKFFEYYFSVVGNCASQKQAFEIVNQMYYLIFNEHMFTGYESFRKQKNRFLKH